MPRDLLRVRALLGRIGARAAGGVADSCANCDVTLDEDDAVERDGGRYCCDGCAAGGPCTC